MSTIRIAVAGLGGRGLGWVRLLKQFPGYQVTLLCDAQPALHAAGQAIFNNDNSVAICSDYEAVLADPDIDAVLLAVRSPDQGALAAQALEAGKHVMAEVPAAHTIEDCWRIVLAAERNDRVYLLAEQLRYAGVIDAWQKLVADGELGRITLCEGQYLHYYPWFFTDPATGQRVKPDQLDQFPEAVPNWFNDMPPIHYLPHELSPMLKVLDDRVVEVTAMSTPSPSWSHPEAASPDVQMAMMKTERGTILRMAVSFVQPHPDGEYHWYQLLGTRGSVEWKRSEDDTPKMWRHGQDMRNKQPMDWPFAPTRPRRLDVGLGHGGTDYYPAEAFLQAILNGQPLDFDVYRAIETAAPAILAAESIAEGTILKKVPDFRPNAARPKGQAPDADV